MVSVRRHIEPNSRESERAWGSSKNYLADFTERVELGKTLTESGLKIAEAGTGTSIFDPVLCELVYRWFCIKGGHILDPFAGGSVRGIVAAYLGYKYTGLDLRPEQVEANETQAAAIVPDNCPRWIVGDSRNIKELAAGEYDLIFSCPPYYDLEVYSDDGRDLSTATTYDEFLTVYRDIIEQSVSMLKDNRFACFVVGDIRDKQGFYRGFPSHTRAAFESAGAHLYNEAVLVTAVGSLPIRVGKQFGGYRKLGKTHQNVLVFYKGNPKNIKETFGEIVVDAAEIERMATAFPGIEIERIT